MKNNQKDIQNQITEIVAKINNSQTLTLEELTKFNSFLLAKVKYQQDQITNLTQKNKRLTLAELGKQTENYSLGGILSPPLTYDRPLPPNRKRHNSLPNSVLGSRATSPLPTSIHESDENFDDEEGKEAFYIAMNAGLEKDNAFQKKENRSLSNDLQRLEIKLDALQKQNEKKEQELATQKTNNRQLLKDNEKLVKENQDKDNELKLTNEEYYQRESELEKLQQELVSEKKHNKSLETQIASEWQKSEEAENKYRQLLSQTKKLNKNKDLLEEEKANLIKSVDEQAKNYQTEWKEREEEHKKLINSYRAFNSLSSNKPTIAYKRKTFDLMPTHHRSNSLNSISRKPQQFNLGFALFPQTPISPKGNIFDLDQESMERSASPALTESETNLDQAFNSLVEFVDDYEKTKAVEIPAETVNQVDDLVIQNEELNKQLAELKQQRAEYIGQIGQKDEAMRNLVNENLVLQNQIKHLEKTLLQLNQNSLNSQELENKLKGELSEKDFWLQSAEEKKAKFLTFAKSLEKTFPLSEKQEVSLNEVSEPEIIRLLYLRNNIFSGVNKLKDKNLDLENNSLENMEKIRQKMKGLTNLAQEAKTKFAKLENKIEIISKK